MGFAAAEEDLGGIVLVKETEAYKQKKRASKHKKTTDKKKTKKDRDPNKKRKERKRSKPTTKTGPSMVPVAVLGPEKRSSRTNIKEVKKNDAGKTPGSKTPAKEEMDPFEVEVLKQKAEVRRKTDERLAILAAMPKSGEKKPPRSGDSKPQRSGDMRMPRSGDSKPQRSGDLKPPRSGNVKAPRSGGLKPPRSGNMKPPRSGNAKMPKSADKKPAKSGDRRSGLARPDPVRAKAPRKDKKRTTDKPSKNRKPKDRNAKKLRKAVTPRAITPLSDVKKVAEKVKGEKKEDVINIDALVDKEPPTPKEKVVDVVVSQEALKKDDVVVRPSKEDPKESRELPSKEVVDAIPVETPTMQNSGDLPLARTQSTVTSQKQVEVQDATTPDIPMQATQPMQQTPAAASKTNLKSEDGKTPITATSIPQLTNREDVIGARQLQPSMDNIQMNVVQPNVAAIGSKTEITPATVPKPTPPGVLASSSPLNVNIDEVLRLGSVMERQGPVSQPKKQAFEWMAMNRDRVEQKPKTFSTNLMTALGDVEVDRDLAINSLSELKKAGTLTEDEFLVLMKMLQVLTAPITVGQVAYLVHTEVAYYKKQKIEDKE